MKREWCEGCQAWRYVLVGFEGEIWCVRCSAPLNQNARVRDLVNAINDHFAAVRTSYNTVVFGASRTVVMADDQTGVESHRVRVTDVINGQPLTVVPQHLFRAS